MLSLEQLAEYEIDPARGFLPAEDPLASLPPYFAAWDALGADLPALLLAGQARSYLDRLEPLAIARLAGKAERERAMLLLSTFAGAYVWGGPEPAARLPAGLAVPLWELADQLGRKPIIGHASGVLQNWRRLDPQGPIALENLALLQPFLGSSDEAWFILVTVEIEARGAPAIPQLVRAQRAATAGDLADLTDALGHIAAVIAQLSASLMRMYERCDPYIFYHRVRPFVASWPAPGVIYTGVSEQPHLFAGGSAGQSALIQALDAALGVRHPSPQSSPYLAEMRRYMPPPHQRFVAALEAGPDLHTFVSDQRAQAPALVEAYNRCVAELADFRRKHMEIAIRYISMQAPSPKEAVGTGGTSLARFLGAARQETRESKIS